MGLEIESQIFKWLQSLKIVREGKRASSGKVQLPEPVTNRLFDGLYISQIIKIILKHRGEEETINKLNAIKENSTPAIRLYNWNLLAEALKKLGHTVDYAEKSKLLNLQNEPLIKIIKYLWSLRVEQNLATGSLAVSTTDIGSKALTEASNIFQFLIISICQHFKLSVQHALNLFLDNNKYLAHLLVKGVKSSYEPVYSLLDDCRKHLGFIIDSLLCVDQKQSLELFLGALKPCLISKEPQVAQKFLTLLKQLCQHYLSKGLKLDIAQKWMESQGFDTIFFSIKRHSNLFAQSLSVAFAYMDERLFMRLRPQDRSLLWNGEAQRLSFYRNLLTEAHIELFHKFLTHPVFQQWNKVCMKALKKAYTPEQKFELINLFETLWTSHGQALEKSPLDIPGAYSVFLKNCTLSDNQLIFIESSRVLFTLIVRLGETKNQYAPILYKAAILALGGQEKTDNIQFMLQGFLQIMRDIPSLPAAPLAEPILRLIDQNPSVAMLGVVKAILAQGRAKVKQTQELQECLVKIILSHVNLSALAQEILLEHMSIDENSAQDLVEYSIASLAQFYSISRETNRTLKELKIDFQRYHEDQSMHREESSHVRNIKKIILLSNIVSFLQKAIYTNMNLKQDLEAHIFHTYIRIERQLKRQYLSMLLLPLMRSYYDQDELPQKLANYLDEGRPPILNFESIVHSQQESIEASPQSSVKSKRKKISLKTQESIKNNGNFSIIKDLQKIKKKQEEQKQRLILQQKKRQAAEQKKQLYYSKINEKRVVQYGKPRVLDVDYTCLLQFDSNKNIERPLGLHEVHLLNLETDEEIPYIQDAQAVIKKYKKIWRYLFFKFSSFGLKGQAQGQHPQEKIGVADINKFLKQFQLELLSKQKVLNIVKKINEFQKRRNDVTNLPYIGFQEFILQYCHQAYRREFPQLAPGRQIIKLIEHLRSVTASKGGSVEMFDSPQEMYFQETDVIRQFNRRLNQNSEYPLPEGYKKVKQTQMKFYFSMTQFQKGINPSRQTVVQVLDEILSDSLGFRLIEPLTAKEQKCLARPALFQKIKDKMKDYTGGYLMPKKSAYLPRIEKDASPVKPEFHPFIPFSLGIKLGIANTDPRDRILAEEVAYWLDDALDAVEAGKLKVGNKSKARIQNQLIKRKRSEAMHYRIHKQEQEKKESIRAESLKNQTSKYHEDQREKEKRTRQEMKLQRQKRKQREELLIQKKKDEYAQAKRQLDAKRKQIEDKKQAQLQVRKKEKVEYKKNVEEYFKKKKQELETKQRTIKESKEQDEKIKADKKEKQINFKRKLQIEIFKKQESVLQKLTDTRQSYEQIWKSQQIQQQIQNYRPGLKLMFQLLVKYEKSKISTTGTNQIGLNTLNFYALRTKLIPLLVGKNAISMLFRSSIKNETKNGLNYSRFEEMLFKIAVKGKSILNAPNQEEEGFEMVESQMPSYKSSPEIESPNKKALTDEYTFDASGVTEKTVRKLMQYLRLPSSKTEAEERFRELLEMNTSKPPALVLKEARSMLKSTLI